MFGGLLAWFAYGGLVMSWAGHRPTTPDDAHPFPYQNHGLMFVSARDLHDSHLLLAAVAGFVVLAVVFCVIGSLRHPGFVVEELSRRPEMAEPAPLWKVALFLGGFVLLMFVLPRWLRH
jgi:hypothetical protein